MLAQILLGVHAPQKNSLLIQFLEILIHKMPKPLFQLRYFQKVKNIIELMNTFFYFKFYVQIF